MKCIVVSTACVLSVLVAVTSAAPFFPGPFSASTNLQVGGGSGNGAGAGLANITNILSDIDIPAILKSINSIVKVVGVFCPPLSQVLDNVIQNVTSTAFRVFGRLILRNGGLGGGGSNSNNGDSGQKVNVVLPTFPPDDEDYDEDDETDVDSRNSGPASTEASTTEASTEASTDAMANALQRTSTLYTSPDKENAISRRHVRVVRQAEDQNAAESAPQPAQDLSNLDDDADRNKRFLPFGGDGHGSTGGSGNFLFDIIRNTADRAARTVGTVYRMVAGTENLGWGLTATSETIQTETPSADPTSKLVAGSGATEETDEKAHSPGGVAEVDISGKAGDGYTEGIPGPITRLFVIANRGIANLVQDLILRLAQTSERLVNFKARLVTSLI